ncbi:MAG: sigma-70 family RNA polymerase sigma factor [Verrucomicrobiota bacterium]
MTSYFEAEFCEMRPELLAYAAATSGDPDCAEDIVQQAQCLAWERREQYRADGNLRGWLMRMVYFKALSHRRDRAREGRLVFNEEIVQRIAEKAEEVVTGEAQRVTALKECLEKLSPEQRQMLACVYARGETVPEYAKKYRLSVQACYKTLSRLRIRLRECVERRMKEE